MNLKLTPERIKLLREALHPLECSTDDSIRRKARGIVLSLNWQERRAARSADQSPQPEVG